MAKAVNDCLNYWNRKVKTEIEKRENQLKKQRVYSENGYLFIPRKISEDFLNKPKLKNISCVWTRRQ